MKNRSENDHNIRLGPLALLLTVICICMTVLAILTFTTAGADLRVARNYADTVSARAELDNEGEELLAKLENGAEALEMGFSGGSDGVLEKILEKGELRLKIGILQDTGKNRWTVVKWEHSRNWQPDEDIGKLWQE